MLTTVVFDLGNVLVGWDPRRPFADLPAAAVDEFLLRSPFAELNHAMDAGMPFADAHTQMRSRAPEHADSFERYWDGFASTLTGPVPGMAELVAEVGEAGLRRLGLTNWAADTYHHAAVAAPVIETLDDVLVSGRVGLAKPDPAIFELLIERFDLAPAQTLFVDDVAANVDGARSVGLRAHLFQGAEGLRAELVRSGVRLS